MTDQLKSRNQKSKGQGITRYHFYFIHRVLQDGKIFERYSRISHPSKENYLHFLNHTIF